MRLPDSQSVDLRRAELRKRGCGEARRLRRGQALDLPRCHFLHLRRGQAPKLFGGNSANLVQSKGFELGRAHSAQRRRRQACICDVERLAVFRALRTDAAKPRKLVRGQSAKPRRAQLRKRDRRQAGSCVEVRPAICAVLKP